MKNTLAMQQLKKAYQDDALEVAVYGASPVGLIVLLYEGAIRAINQAKVLMANERHAEKTQMINKASDIVEGLRVALDHRHDANLSLNLEDLYIYVKFRLGVANMKNDPDILDEVANLLGVILPAWQEVAKTQHAGEASRPQASV
ncbi:flagellar export chaperone FliS [Paludibacterium purpuratum]|uniref:Flagellar secretion chaperone FliS n=1 Tax=Paludibacterium purpuratum TaxID=1144873 RepID=A0A4R7B4F8_9NEIS|nr:flagellar export chaperone FliS [Paludibacterium purpuratum]TDR78451.1 flagellar protein FliS [Paludibacterium purpuratum]